MESKQKKNHKNKNHPKKNNKKRFARLHSFLYSDN